MARHSTDHPRPASLAPRAGRRHTRSESARPSVGAVATLVLLSAVVVLTTGLPSGSAADRIGVRTLIEDAPTRLRLAAVVIASAVRDLGTRAESDRHDDPATAIVRVSTGDDGLMPAASCGFGTSVALTLRNAMLRNALRAIPPPSA